VTDKSCNLYIMDKWLSASFGDRPIQRI
jgi:hypothetical protein